jgi:hypothetical protein
MTHLNPLAASPANRNLDGSLYQSTNQSALVIG